MVGMINAAKETCHLLTRILAFASHLEYCRFQKFFDNLGPISSLCRHYHSSSHDKEANND